MNNGVIGVVLEIMKLHWSENVLKLCGALYSCYDDGWCWKFKER